MVNVEIIWGGVVGTFYCNRHIFFTGTLTIGAIEFNLLKPTGYVMHQQFNIQQLYALPTLYLCVVFI